MSFKHSLFLFLYNYCNCTLDVDLISYCHFQFINIINKLVFCIFKQHETPVCRQLLQNMFIKVHILANFSLVDRILMRLKVSSALECEQHEHYYVGNLLEVYMFL